MPHKDLEKQREYEKEYYHKNRDKLSLYKKEYRCKNGDKIREHERQYRIKNGDKIALNQKRCKQKNKDKITLYGKEYRLKNRDNLILKQRRRCEQYPEKTRITNRKSLLKRRLSTLDKIGGINPQCSICGFSDRRALQIDHINNDGYLENNKNHGRMNFKYIGYEDIHKKYQILCANCNTIKEYERKQYKFAQKNDQDKQEFKIYKDQIMDEATLINIQFMEVS